jgi:tRNA U38,U39,U40 pseudouridine synthase TruA
MLFNRKFKLGEKRIYMKDYFNLRNRIDINAKEFEKVLEKTFPGKYKCKIVKTKGWITKEYDLVEAVYEENKEVMYNKSFIVVKEATEEEEGLIIGIHDFNNFKATIDRIDNSIEYIEGA